MVEARRKISSRTIKVHSEETLYSKDGLLLGSLMPSSKMMTALIVDYKSGSITDETTELPKEEYINQLYFYAFLVLENFGKYPRSLRLTGRELESTEVNGSIEVSTRIAQRMRSTLSRYNELIEVEHPSTPSLVHQAKTALFVTPR